MAGNFLIAMVFMRDKNKRVIQGLLVYFALFIGSFKKTNALDGIIHVVMRVLGQNAQIASKIAITSICSCATTTRFGTSCTHS